MLSVLFVLLIILLLLILLLLLLMLLLILMLFENNAPINKDAIKWACVHRYTDIFDYLILNNGPYNKEDLCQCQISSHVPKYSATRCKCSTLYIERYQNIYIDILEPLMNEDCAKLIVSYLI